MISNDPVKALAFLPETFQPTWLLSRRFEAQHLIHAIQEAGVKKWMALTEGAGSTLGWLTVRHARSIRLVVFNTDTIIPIVTTDE